MNADHIIVLEQGRIMERGNHEDLINAKGRYADLWSKQISAVRSRDVTSTHASQGQFQLINDLSERQNSAQDTKAEQVEVALGITTSQSSGQFRQSSAVILQRAEVESVEDETSLADSDLSL